MPKEDTIEVEVQDSFDAFNEDVTTTKDPIRIDFDGTVLDTPEEEIELELPEELKGTLNAEEVVIEEPAENPEVEEVIQGRTEEEEEEARKKQEAEKKRKSRAKARIKEQNSRIKELESVIAQQQQQMQTLQTQHDETTSTYAKVELERLTADVARLEAALKQAAENGDGEAIAATTKQLIESQTHIKNLQAMADAAPAAEPAQAPKQQASAPALSAAAEDWSDGKEFLIDNEEYKALTLDQRKVLSPIRHDMAQIAGQLLNEGFANDDPIFYEEMDIRLAAKYDIYEALASDGLDALDYKNSEQESTPNDASGETEKPQKSNKSKNVPTKGASRSSSPNLSSKSPNKVTMSPEDYKYWKNHLQKHLTLEEYALEMLKDQQRSKF